MDTSRALAKAHAALALPGVKRAAVYLTPKLVVSICRRFKPRARDTRQDFVVKVGVPNYLEVRFIKALQKAKEPFPVKKVQLKFWPKKRARHA